MEIVVPQPFMGNADENSDEDEMMEGDYPVELQIEPQGNVDDSSEPSEEFFEQDPAFFDQNGSNGEEEDEEQNDVENESFTESEESGDEEDGDVEEQEFDPANGLGFYPNEGLNNDPIVEWEADSQEDSQEEDEEDADRFHDLMSNRHDEIANITQLVQQRMGFGANIRNQGRVIPPTEFNIMGRPIFAGRNSQSHAILSHPLLVNQDSSRRGGNVPRGMPNLSPMADFEIVDRDEIPIPYLDQLLPITRNSTLGDIGQLAPSLPESEVEQQIRAIHSHTLLFSDESLKQLNLILFGGVAAEIATKYGNHVMNTLLPDAYSTKLEQKKLAEKKVEEERLKKEQEDKEREKAELEKKKEEEEAVAAAASARLEDTSMLNETEEDVPVALEAPVEEQRIVVVVDGNAVDITGKHHLIQEAVSMLLFWKLCPMICDWKLSISICEKGIEQQLTGPRLPRVLMQSF